MFSSLRNLWRSEAPLEEHFGEFLEMLGMCREMYRTVSACFDSGDCVDDPVEQVYRADVRINKTERRIRKHLVTHLALSQNEDAVGSLVLMSVVKDAERVGDLCKNLYESWAMWKRPLRELRFGERMEEFERYVQETFDKTIRAFEDEDDTLAGDIMQDEVHMNRQFDALLERLADSDVGTREAVCTTLLVRNLKRIQAHLANIASSVVVPVHRVDHRPKELRKGFEE